MKPPKSSHKKSTITLTFGDVAENHPGMEKIGKFAEKGFTLSDLYSIIPEFPGKDAKVHEMVLGGTTAGILIVKNGASALCNTRELHLEQARLEKDKKAFMYGRVVNKLARHNLCFADFSREPDYEKKKGRVYSFESLPELNKLRGEIHRITGKCLNAEGNYYYDIEKCGIGFHGDAERKMVVAVRLGDPMPIVFRWYKDNKQVGKEYTFELGNGDLYIMSEKATGFDWKRKSIFTLRHAAGCKKYIQ